MIFTVSESERDLLDALFSGQAHLHDMIERHLAAPLPMIGGGQPVREAVALLEPSDAALVLIDGKPRGVLTRQDLLAQLLPHRHDTNTKAIVERAQRPAESIIMGVMNVFECWADERLFDPRLDFAIREWARRSEDVRRMIDQADDERLTAIRDMYRRHGYDAEDAFIRARVLYYMQIGYYVLDLKEPVEARVSHLAAYLRAFTGQEPSDADVAHFMRFIAAR